MKKILLLNLIILLSFFVASCDLFGGAKNNISNNTTTEFYTPIPTPTPVNISFKIDDSIKLIEQPKASSIIEYKNAIEVNKTIISDNIQANIINIANKYIGEKETKGNNRSPFIDKINLFTNVDFGSPYCSSFVSWVLYEAGAKNFPKTAWSPTMVSKNNILFNNIKSADVFGLYFSSKGRIAHVGFIKSPNYNSVSISTIEANTSPNAAIGSEQDRNGDGIFSKLRSKKLMANPNNKFSRYW